MKASLSAASAGDDLDDGERAFAGQRRDYMVEQACRLARRAAEAAKVKAEFL